MTGCAHDVVLPSAQIAAVCGNGIVEPGEECDVSSPGCESCLIVPDYACTSTGCSVLCGDGVVGDGPDCGNPRKPEACDMNGYWMARETDFTRDRIVGSVSTASTWYLYRFTQTGSAFQVQEVLHCGIHVSGSATVEYTPETLRVLIYKNEQDPMGTHGPRRGTFAPQGDGCVFSFDRWYNIRGAVDSLLPTDFSTHPKLASLPPLPTESNPVNPTGTNLAGALDTDSAGVPGYSVQISGFVSGLRYSVEREYKEYATPMGATVPPNAIQFVSPGDWDLETSVLAVKDCGAACALIATDADAAHDITNRITFRFVGKTLGSVRLLPVVAAAPRESLDADLLTCANVRFALPHDASQE
jgi:hypothetical protein